jgi:SAM-dependent methyltransferase
MKMQSKTFDTNFFLKVYSRKRPFFLSMTRSVEASLFQKYLPFKRPVLDVGCGDGFFARLVFKNGVRSSGLLRSDPEGFIDVGLDVEDSRMKEAESKRVYKKIVVYGGEQMPFHRESYQTVVTNCVLEHIPNLEMTVREVRRVLKKGGIFIASVATDKWEEYLFGNIFLGSIYRNWMRKKQVHFNLFSRSAWNTVFQKNGFTIVDEIGYLSKPAVRWIDFLHYVCIPNLLTYKILGKWVVWPSLTELFPIRFFAKLLDKEISPKQSACIFFVLRKEK